VCSSDLPKPEQLDEAFNRIDKFMKTK